MTARDVDIDVDMEVDVDDLIAADALIDSFIAKVKQIDDEIKIDIDLLDGNVKEDLREIERLTKELDREHIHIGITMDNVASEVTQIHTQLQTVDTNRKIDIDFSSVTAATTAVQNLNNELGQIDRHIKIDIDIDLSDFMRDIAAIQAQLTTIQRQNIDIDVDTTSAMAQIAALQAQLAALQGSSRINIGGSSSFGGFLSGGWGALIKIGMIVTGLLTLLPLLMSMLQILVGVIGGLGVAIGVVTGGLVALASAAAIAVAGIAGPLVLGISAITALYEKDAKLTWLQKRLKTHTDDVADSFKKLQTTVQPITYGAIVKGSKTLMGLLETLTPITERAGEAVSKLISNFRTSINGENMLTFFDYLERSTKPLTLNIGNGLGLFMQGIFNLMVALEPLTNWVAQGFENMMSRFASWGERMQTSDKMQAFMDYTMENMPKLGKIMGNTVDGIVDFFAAFDVSAAQGFDWLIEKTQEFAEWASKLDENEGFQNMLERIKNDGPVVASILGNVATNLGKIVGFISDIGRGEDGENKLFGLMDKVTGKGFEGIGKTALQDLLFGSIWSIPGKLGIDWMDVLGLSNIGEQISNLNIGSKIKTALSGIPGLKGLFSAGTLAIKLFTDFKWPALPKISWPALPKFNWPSLPRFNWPSLPKFNWPSLPKFSWPKLPTFKWPSFPKFTWPTLPKLSISLGKGILNKFGGGGGNEKEGPGFSTGLGRVNLPEMPAIVHKNEAILQDHNAQFLRDVGILKGDGRNPQIDTGAISAYGSPQSTTTYVADNRPSNGGTKIDVGGVQIVVQGGNTNDQTAQSVRKAVEQVFASLGDVIPLGLEG